MAKKVIVPQIGSQIPRIDIFTPGNTDKAELLFELLDEYGMHLDEWQRLVLRRWLAEDADGKFVNLECGLSVARQNGKTEIFAARIIYGIIFRKASGLLTTQQQDTADVVKKRVQDFFYENTHEEIFNLLTPRFRKKPRNYDYMHFENGASYKFKTRMRLSGLGNTNDEVLNDEAAEMMDSHQSTLMPTVSSAKSGNPQFIYAGTPPVAESVGEVFARVRDKKMKGGKGSWTEWSVESFTDKDDVDSWYSSNPSLGIRLLRSVVEAEADSMSPDDFNRMRLGWWSGIESKRAISQAEWDALINEKPEYDEEYKPIFAVKFSPDRSTFTLTAAQPLDDGRIHVEVVMHRPMSEGFHRLAKWLKDRHKSSAKIILDGQTGAPILYEELIKNGVPKKKILLPNMKEVVTAHQFMRDAIDQGEFSHYNQPVLNQAVKITKERSFGRYGGFGWDSMSKELSTSPIDSATYGLWGQKVHGKKKPQGGDKAMSDDRWKQVLSSL
jgi:phage terminase large subunit-like protein